MYSLTITLSAVSFLTLVFGMFAWKLTSSRSVAFNTLFCSAGLLFAAYFHQTGQHLELTYIIPFLVFTMFAGRAIGFGYRSSKESDLRLPTALLGTISAFALGAAVVVYVNR